ncbi:hypothetical protein FJTKL_02257 [Diaporthe vaccinii]|uniref:FAD-binding domain-containing protein n=1 Tax=Diaporthe vaccinii TaxID=105482 RepID=A0ABR4F3H0_9PEZI
MVGDEQGVGQPAKVVCGSRVVGVDPEAGVLYLDDGTSVESDLIIGADGIHSVVRNTVTPSTHTVPAPCGLSMYRFVLPMEIVKNALGHDHENPAVYD